MSRRLFEQAENNNPSTAKKIAFGAAGVITENITLANFLTWLMGKLAFLKTTNDLSDLVNVTTARSNLGVYGSAEVDALLLLKANLYPEAAGALGTTNTTLFVPSANYHPATKTYVDEGGIATAWLDCTRVSAKVDSGSFIAKIARVGGFVTITGTIQFDSQPAESEVLFTLPASIPTASIDIYFNASDDGTNDENIELKILAGTRNVVANTGGSSVSSLNVYCVTYPHN